MNVVQTAAGCGPHDWFLWQRVPGVTFQRWVRPRPAREFRPLVGESWEDPSVKPQKPFQQMCLEVLQEGDAVPPSHVSQGVFPGPSPFVPIVKMFPVNSVAFSQALLDSFQPAM